MLAELPSPEELKSYMGSKANTAWNKICDFIEQNYEIYSLWDNGGKYGKYVLRYKKGGRTLCTLYVRDNQFGCWLILGQTERDKFERTRENFTDEMQNIYDTTAVYHDGKWVMLEVTDGHLLDDIKKMIMIKKKPNKKR